MSLLSRAAMKMRACKRPGPSFREIQNGEAQQMGRPTRAGAKSSGQTVTFRYVEESWYKLGG